MDVMRMEVSAGKLNETDLVHTVMQALIGGAGNRLYRLAFGVYKCGILV